MSPNPIIKEHALRSPILAWIKFIDPEHTLTAEQSDNMASSLAMFVMLASKKYIDGQKEHGGDIRERNLLQEMANEQIDLFWYGPLGAMGWPILSKKEEETHHD